MLIFDGRPPIPETETLNSLREGVELEQHWRSGKIPFRVIEEALHLAQSRLAEALGLRGAEGVRLFSSGVEAANAAVKGFAWGAEGTRKGLAAVKGDPEGWMESCMHQERYGYKLKTLSLTPEGDLDAHSIDQIIDAQTAVAGLSSITPQVYAPRSWEDISQACKNYQVPLAVDITNEIRLQNVSKYIGSCQAMVCDGLDLGSPMGGAVLWIKPGSRWSPLINGGDQQAGLRGGYFPLGPALALTQTLSRNMLQREKRLEKFERLLWIYLDEMSHLLSDAIIPQVPERWPLGLSFILPGLEGEALVEMLKTGEVYISTGSACVSAAGKPSPVLVGMGYAPELVSGAVQVNFRDEHTEADVKALVRRIVRAANNLWRISGRKISAWK
ncbi:MAG: aminotransferase class V-fold PLP-dependent enzyme [Calditrichota bacterium]